MRTSLGFIIVSVVLSSFINHAFADDPVDLNGKQGVVDPSTLKASDPPAPVVNSPPPPPPQVPEQTNPVAAVRG